MGRRYCVEYTWPLGTYLWIMCINVNHNCNKLTLMYWDANDRDLRTKLLKCTMETGRLGVYFEVAMKI